MSLGLVLVWGALLVGWGRASPLLLGRNDKVPITIGENETPPLLSLFKPPEMARETVRLESEGVGSRLYTAYDIGHQKLRDQTQLQPIVDTISEHEKYGNEGDRFEAVSRSLVDGYEAFSNFLNALIEGPKGFTRSISRGITAKLETVGAKLVGL